MPFSQQYPFLTYYIENHGWIQFGIDDDSPYPAFLTILDMGGVHWVDEESSSVEEALQKAEEILRTKVIPDLFGQEVVREIEAAAKRE